MAKVTFKAGYAAVVLAACVMAACEPERPKHVRRPIDAKDIVARKVYPALQGTVGQFADLLDSGSLPVEGFGLVVNLPDTGSGDMTPEVRQILSSQLYRAGAGSYVKGTEAIEPGRILSSKKVAAVEVHGLIPPLAKRGQTFDLTMTVVPSNEATSIENGLLWTTPLKVIGLRTDLDTNELAAGRGPLYMPDRVQASIGASTQPASTKSLRTAIVMGGGTVAVSRDSRLQLLSQSFRLSGAIERAINSHFQEYGKAANAQDDKIIDLNIPPDYSASPMLFVEVAMHMFLAQDMPGFSEKKAAELIKALADPAAPHRELSLALQGLGRSVLPEYIQPAYTSPNPAVRFWAGRAGAGLNDVGGMVVLEATALDPQSPFQQQAISSIVEVSRGTDTVRATLTLMKVLNGTNTRDRIQAYGGLIAIRSGAVRTFNVSKKFMLDIVPSSGTPMIYVTQTGTPRIALIGDNFVLPPGALYVSDDNLLTINVADAGTPSAKAVDAVGGDGMVLTAASTGTPEESGMTLKTDPLKNNVTLYWRGPMGDEGLQLTTGSRLADLVARLSWEPDPLRSGYDRDAKFIGASYQRVVEMLGAMCRDRTLPALFVEQHALDATALMKESMPTGRSEVSTTQPKANSAGMKATVVKIPQN